MLAQTKLPETTYEQRSEFYSDVQELIVPGFLSQKVTIGGTRISLRSPNPGDFYLTKHRADFNSDSKNWICWMLASLTWMIDGHVVLGQPNIAPEIYKMYRKMGAESIACLMSIATGLFSRLDKGVKAISSFCLEDTSRFLWKQCGGVLPASPSVTGVPGSDQIGLNSVQKIWITFNLLEDQKTKDLAAWSYAKFVASASNPKGVKRLDGSEQARVQREKDVRQEERDIFYYRAVGVLDENNLLSDGSKLMKQASSREELVDEYQRWVLGDDDFHDMVVRQYKENLIAKYSKEKEERESEIQSIRESDYDMGAVSSMPDKLVAFDLSSLREMQIQKREMNVKRVYDDSTRERDRLFNDHIDNDALPPPKEGFSITERGIEIPSTEGAVRRPTFGRGPSGDF